MIFSFTVSLYIAGFLSSNPVSCEDSLSSLHKLLTPLKKSVGYREPKFFFDMCAVGVRRVDPYSMGLIIVGEAKGLAPSRFIGSIHRHLGPVVMSDLDSNHHFGSMVMMSDLDSNRHLGSVVMGTRFQAVMILIEEEHILKYVADLHTATFWNPLKLYVFVIDSDCTELMVTFLQQIWDKHRVDNTIVVCSRQFRKLYSYDPNIMKLSTYTRANQKELLVKLRRERILNLNGQPLTVTMFPTTKTAILRPDGSYGAADGYLLKLLADRMNFTPITLVPEDGQRYGQKLRNGTLTGALAKLSYGETPILTNRIFIKQYSASIMEFTTPFDFDQLCVLVPKAEKNHIWMFILLCFERDVWILLAVCYVLSIVIWFIVRSVIDRKQPDSVQLAIELLQIFLNSSIRRKLRTTSERVFVVFVVIFSLLMAHTFQTYLVKSFSTRTYKKDINTLEDLDKSHLKVYVASKNLGDTFLAENNAIMSSLFKKFIYNFKDESNRGRWKRIAYDKDIAVLGKERDLIDQINLVTENGDPLLHLVKECPRAYHSAYSVGVNSPYMESINRIIGQSLAAGLFKSWFFNNMSKRQSVNVVNQETWRSDNVTFSLEHLTVAFTTLVVGLSLASVVFLLELVTYRCCCRKSHRS
ncbi:uncharacterized protein LOC111062548 [Nilaparvata lugens]|uniref:uncharacterized protein LOC111062548 n=1 Tax=Nilaparvata lugens TaxID=108931 RepID=UPI00193DF13C|nr:uncharacterized protein LOC111062548 [Nilaparvata lugens]